MIKLIVFKYYGKYLHLHLITVLTKVIAIIFVFENFIAFVIVFKYYAMYLDPSLVRVPESREMSVNYFCQSSLLSSMYQLIFSYSR